MLQLQPFYWLLSKNVNLKFESKSQPMDGTYGDTDGCYQRT